LRNKTRFRDPAAVIAASIIAAPAASADDGEDRDNSPNRYEINPPQA
jgi:hypothetical protein